MLTTIIFLSYIFFSQYHPVTSFISEIQTFRANPPIIMGGMKIIFEIRLEIPNIRLDIWNQARDHTVISDKGYHTNKVVFLITICASRIDPETMRFPVVYKHPC